MNSQSIIITVLTIFILVGGGIFFISKTEKSDSLQENTESQVDISNQNTEFSNSQISESDTPPQNMQRRARVLRKLWFLNTEPRS